MVQSVDAELEQREPRHGLARVMTNGELVYEDDYEPTSILLTGGAGFIGSHVAILLANKYPQYKVRIDAEIPARCTAGSAAPMSEHDR